nr:ribonuclease H-like domain-containing protein [Tanacetum cinerariifolium]
MCDSSVECSRPNQSDHNFNDSISSVSTPASESRDTIVIDCDRQEDFPSVCTSSIETDVKSSKTLCNKFGSFNKESHFRKHKSVAFKYCYVCGSYLHLIKDCDLHEQRFAKRNAEGKGILGRRTTGKPVNLNRPKPVSAGQQNLISAGPLNPVFAEQLKTQFLLDSQTQFLLDSQTQFLLDSQTQFLLDNSLRLEKAKDRGIVDSGCSRDMSGNKEKLEDFEDFHGREVTFRGSTGKISGKGTIKTMNLNFENVLYVEELQHFNLISVSQICDQTHRVLFTKNECLVLSKDFPLPGPSKISLVDQVWANPTLSAELLGADVSEDTFSVRMVELMNRRRKEIGKMKAKAKIEKPMTPAQQKEFMRNFIIYDKIRRVVDLATAKDHHQHLKRSVGDPISALTSVPVASFIPAATPIAAGVSTTAGAFGSASEASVPIIELLDSPPQDTSLPLDLKIEELDEPLRKSSRKKSIATKRTLPSPSKPKSDALPFDEDNPKTTFKRYLRQAFNDDEPAEPVSLALVSDITSWEIIPIEFRRGEIHVITRADELVADLKLEILALPAIHVLETEVGDIMYMFVDKKYPLTPETLQQMLNHGLEIDRDPSGNDLTTAIQLIQSLLNQLNPAA